MKPGRELDALVAERVMGLEKIENPRAEYETGMWTNGTILFQLPEYSIDIAAAWEVMEKFKNDRPYLTVVGNEVVAQSWLCEFHRLRVYMNYGDTAPEAICRAALKAVGHNLDQ